MSQRRKWLTVPLILLGFATVILFNNCNGMEAIRHSRELGSSLPGPDDSSNGSTAAGREYFENTLAPMMAVSCTECHALPKDVAPGNPRGPLTIFDYSFLRNFASAGPSASNNPLLNELKGVGHEGGNICSGDPNGEISPCLEFKFWVSLEFPSLAEGIAGAVVNVSPTGVVRGWALDPEAGDSPISVIVYTGGAAGEGQFVAQVLANESSGDQNSGHYFTVNLPPALADGSLRSLYIYGIDAGSADNLLPGMPHNYVAYTPSQAGRDHYNQQVRPLLNACVNCHGNLVNYDQHFLNLLNPKPAEGGTALNNELINKLNGENHPGGGFCGNNKNAGPCAQVRDWWTIEFN